MTPAPRGNQGGSCRAFFLRAKFMASARRSFNIPCHARGWSAWIGLEKNKLPAIFMGQEKLPGLPVRNSYHSSKQEAFDAQCSIRISNEREIWLITSMTLTECRPIAQPVSLRKGQLFGMDSQEHCESKHGFESETVTHCTACLPGTLYLLELLNFGAGFKIHWSLDMISMGDIGRMLSFELSVFGVYL